ncbi:hypothetical protein ACIRTB_27935 [Streptomyces sp. NPDC101158]|uniref:hypothetical protein n=1 Tax=Streptomyces sp. NPDC101158 TaxID=3366117 RepID=UPI00380F16DB
MRPLASRRLTVLAITAAVTLGTAGTAFADEHRPSRPATHAGTRAPLPDATALKDAAAALKAQIETAVDGAKGAASLGAAQSSAAPSSAAPSPASAPVDIGDDLLATVQKAVADLLAAVSSGNVTGIVPQVASTVTSLVDQVVATALGSGSAVPGLPALPSLSGLPATPDLPAVPSPPAVPELPAAPDLPVTLPSTDGLPAAPPVSTGALP